MLIKEMKMNQVQKVLSQATVNLGKSAVDSDQKVSGKWKKFADSAISDGITSAMFTKPAKGEANPNELLHNQVNDMIVSTFTEHVQKIIAKETKTLNEVDKETKRYWVRQISSYFNKVRMHIAKVENEGEANEPRVPKTKVERIKEHLAEAVRIAQAIESPNFAVNDFIKAIKLEMAKVA